MARARTDTFTIAEISGQSQHLKLSTIVSRVIIPGRVGRVIKKHSGVTSADARLVVGSVGCAAFMVAIVFKGLASAFLSTIFCSFSSASARDAFAIVAV